MIPVENVRSRGLWKGNLAQLPHKQRPYCIASRRSPHDFHIPGGILVENFLYNFFAETDFLPLPWRLWGMAVTLVSLRAIGR